MSWVREYVRNSTVNSSEEQSDVLMKEVLECEEWISYSSLIHRNVDELAEAYMNYFAHIRGPFGNVYTNKPIFIFKYEELKGLYWSNGAVVLYNTTPDHLSLWVDKETTNLFHFPTPESLKREKSN
jgi:hypothetical protein